MLKFRCLLFYHYNFVVYHYNFVVYLCTANEICILAWLWEQGSFGTGGNQSVTLANLFPGWGWWLGVSFVRPLFPSRGGAEVSSHGCLTILTLFFRVCAAVAERPKLAGVE
ncbi:unnamed protein product [Amoebophrya sp. A120]|nr:unnamed protein product [Amoebophrya sp. A120]|eukprot:GSA120T00013020001.1